MPSSRNPIAAAAFGPGTSTPPSPHCRARLSPRSESTPTCWGFWPRRSSGIGLHGRPPHNVEHNVVRRPPNILHSAQRPRKVPPPSAHHEQSTRCGCTGARGRERAWPAHGRVVLLARPARRLVQPQPPPAVSAPVFAGRLCSSPPPPSQLAGRRPCLHGGRGRWDLGWTVFALPTGWTVFHLPSTPRYLDRPIRNPRSRFESGALTQYREDSIDTEETTRAMAARRRPPLTSPKEQPPPHAAVNQALTTVTLENQDHEAQILHVVPPLARRAWLPAIGKLGSCRHGDPSATIGCRCFTTEHTRA